MNLQIYRQLHINIGRKINQSILVSYSSFPFFAIQTIFSFHFLQVFFLLFNVYLLECFVGLKNNNEIVIVFIRIN